MTVRGIASLCFRLTPCRRVFFSTFENPILSHRNRKIEEETVEKTNNSDFPSQNLEKEIEKMNENEFIKYVSATLNFSKMSKIEKQTVIDTTHYLLESGFSKQIISESIFICFYDRSEIEKGLEKIKENELELKKFGLNLGFTKDETHNFSEGSHFTDKRLQLCLYYMEEPKHFRRLIRKSNWIRRIQEKHQG